MNSARLDIQEIKELIKLKFKQMIERPDIKVRPLYIEGHSGIGKTQIVREAAADLSVELAEILKGAKVECRTLNLQFTERPEFMGLSYVTEDKKTAFAYPLLLPETGYGLYFLDEANRVERDIRSGMLTLLEDREINGHKMGKFWLPILAGNPNDDIYEVNELDRALTDRVAKVRMEGNIQHTLSHFKRKYADHPLVDFLAHHQNFISFGGQGISPRSFEYAITATLNFSQIPENLRDTLLAAELGYDAAALIYAYLNDRKTPKYEDVLKGGEEAFGWFTKNPDRNDAVSSISRALISDLKFRTAQKQKFSDDERKNVQTFLALIRDEHKLSLVVDTTKENLTLDFMKLFVQGTPMTESFIKMYSQQKA